MVKISDQKFAQNERKKIEIFNKSKNNHKMNSKKQSVCWFCAQQAEKSRKKSLILMRVWRLLMVEKRKKERMLSIPSEGYFRQLIDYMMQQGEQWGLSSVSCTHGVIKQVLMKKLSICIEELYFLCEGIFQKLSKGRFELEMVQKITKNIHERVLEERKGAIKKKSKRNMKAIDGDSFELQRDVQGAKCVSPILSANIIANTIPNPTLVIETCSKVQAQNYHFPNQFPVIDSSDLTPIMNYKLLSPFHTEDNQSTNIQSTQHIQWVYPLGCNIYDQGQVSYLHHHNNYWMGEFI